MRVVFNMEKSIFESSSYTSESILAEK